MIYSNERKQQLSGWLRKHERASYDSPLRLQKFLFFYEALCKTSNISCDFHKLKGYVRGPVFSAVWGDYTKDREEFDRAVQEQYMVHKDKVYPNIAKQAAFIIKILSESELSQLTHQYDIWNSKASRIMAGEPQVELCEADFSEKDKALTATLSQMYPDTLASSSIVYQFGDKNFVLPKEVAKQLTEQHMDTLAILADFKELHNPVFVDIDERGVLLVD